MARSKIGPAKVPRKAARPRNDLDQLILIGDTHCGSIWGLMPPTLEMAETRANLGDSWVKKHTNKIVGNVIHQNASQRILWGWYQEWLAYVRVKTQGKRVGLIFMGDLTEGVHRGGSEIISHDLLDHAHCAIDVLAPLVEMVDVAWAIKGTKCHVQSAETAACDNLKVHFVGHEFRLTVRDTPMTFFHHGAVSKLEHTKQGALWSQLCSMQLAEGKANWTRTQVLGTAHAHNDRMSMDHSGLAIGMPAWKLHDDYSRKVVPTAIQMVGAKILDWSVCDSENTRPFVYNFRRFSKEKRSVTSDWIDLD
jgi:hypothetical protein